MKGLKGILIDPATISQYCSLYRDTPNAIVLVKLLSKLALSNRQIKDIKKELESSDSEATISIHEMGVEIRMLSINDDNVEHYSELFRLNLVKMSLISELYEKCMEFLEQDEEEVKKFKTSYLYAWRRN